MNALISDRATRRLPLLLVSALAGLFAVAGLIAVARPTRAAGITDISFVVNPPTLTANGSSTAFITVIVYSNSVPISNVLVSGYLSPTASGLGSITAFGLTDPDGHASSTWTAGTVARSGQLIVGDGIVSNTVNITLTAGPVDHIPVLVNPATQIANSNATSIITATAFDVYGNTVPGENLSGSVSPSMGSLSGLGTTGANGQTSGIWRAGTLIGTGTLYVTNGSITGQAAITLTVGEPYTITLLASQTYLYVGETSSLLAYVTDRFNNPVAYGTVVSFTSSLGSPAPFTNTTLNGSTASSINSTVAGTAYITATSGSARGYATVTFAPGAPATLVLEASPTSRVVGNSSVLTATVRDRYVNLVGSGIAVTFTTDLGTTVSPRNTTNGIATSSISSTAAGTAHITATTAGAAPNSTVVTFMPGGAVTMTLGAYPLTQTVGLPSVLTATVKDQYGNYVADGTRVTITNDLGAVISSPVTTMSGIATSTIITTGVGTAHVTATSGLSAQGKVTVTFVPDVPAAMALQASPTSRVVGNSSVLTATVRDRYNNLVGSGIAVTFTTDLGTTVSPRNTTSGIATSSISSTAAGTAHITATTAGAAPNSTVVTFTPGTPMTITVQVKESNLTPNSGQTAMITATAVDNFNNPAPGYQLNGTLVPPSLGSLSSLSLTDGYGRAFGTWTAGNIVVSGRLSVTYGTRTGTADIALLLSKPQTVSVQVVSPTLFANSGMTTLITATVRDLGNNPIPGAAVSFSLAPSTLGSDPASATTDSKGRATSTWTAGSLAGNGTVTANASSSLGSAIGSAPITLTADMPYRLTLQADPASPVAGIGSILMATVLDRFSNPVTDGTWVTFTRDLDLATILSPVSTTLGVAKSQINWTGVGPVLITATSSPATSTITVNFEPNVSLFATLQANPVTQTVGYSSTLTATIRDPYTNLVRDGTLVTFTTSIGNVSPPASVTVKGIVTSSIVVTQSSVAYITVTSGLAQGTTTVTFRAGAPTTTTVELKTRALIVNTGTSTAITATLVDTYSNPVPGATPTGYLLPATLGSLSWQSPTTDLKGQAFGRWWAGTVPGSGVLVVNGASVTVTLAPRTVFLPVVMRNFPPIPTGTLIRINSGADNTFQITVTLQVSASVQADYTEWMRFSNDFVKWGDWVTFAPTATWKLDPRNGLKTVYAQFAGHGGGVSAPISDDILLFIDGDFIQPDLTSWSLDPGNALGVTVAPEPGSATSPAGRLGSPSYACNNVPKGYGSISQYFVMPYVPEGQSLVLRFNYHIVTSDINLGLDDRFDRFEVLLNATPVFKDMNQDKPNKWPSPWPPPPPAVCAVYDLGSQDRTIAITGNPAIAGNPGSNINVTFRVYNLYDNNYNTYVYLDNVRLELQGRTYDLSNEAPSLPETPDGRTGR